MQAELAANAVLQAAYEKAPYNNEEDITVVVIFFDKKLITKNVSKDQNNLLQNILTRENII